MSGPPKITDMQMIALTAVNRLAKSGPVRMQELPGDVGPVTLLCLARRGLISIKVELTAVGKHRLKQGKAL